MAGAGGEAGTTESPEGGSSGSETAGGTGGGDQSGAAGQAGEVQGGAGAPPTCDVGPETLLCGDACVDPKTDNANCGDCGERCTGAATCSNGSCLTCQEGCAILEAPLSLSDGAQFFDVPFTTAVDLSDASVSVRVYCASSVGVVFDLEVLSLDPFDLVWSSTYLESADGWQTATIDARPLEHAATGLVISLIALDRVEPPPTLTVYIDWIRVSDASAGPWEFAVNGNPIAPSLGGSDGVPVVDWRGP